MVAAPSALTASPAPTPITSLPDEVQGSFDFMPATLAGYLAGIAILSVLYWNVAPPSVFVPWLALFAAVWLVRVWMLHRFRRVPPQSLADWVRWQNHNNVGTLACGALWGMAAWSFYPYGDRIHEIGLIIVIYSFCLAAVPVLAMQTRVYMLYAMLCVAPLAGRIAILGRDYNYQLAGILVTIISLTTLLTRRYRQAMERVLELKHQADELLAQLRLEKRAAEAARHEAEVANRAKTQFFTAASHDLRQPLHAMGLFAEALRQKTHDEEVAQLVNSINGSVDALEGLFSELLDITRIDSGHIQPNSQSFAMDEIFRKLRLHFEPTAFEKGLALRLRGGQHVGHADPLLVERIVRNLVSNAIRYTDDGTVLVSCRRRTGRLMLQVWDTGVGIPTHEQQRIFEEFYQVESHQDVAPQQRKGLGLGLAIVKRLADLMQVPLSVRSQQGRGTVFTLELPMGQVARSAPAALSGKAPPSLTLAGRLIVVVEDESAVRTGLEVLLKGWGASIASFDSVGAVKAWVEQADPMTSKPDLLIVDYRLENGLNGLDAINALRSRFGQAVPAIVVTGSTMTGHEQEAQEAGFHLLIKPVVPNKLRAMIAFKLGVKGSSTAQAPAAG
jgi:signal transduction histidine kinase